MRPGPAAVLVLLVGCASRPAALRQPFPGIAVEPSTREVALDAVVCLDAGWLEQVACSPGTRVHESLVSVAARPRNVHAALLLAGLVPGAPGHWSEDEDGGVSLVPPSGERLSIAVRHGDPPVEEPVGDWIADAEGEATFPRDAEWVFGGSAIVPNPPFMGPGEHYVADLTGSIVGLVTFGDEVIGYREVLPDQEAVEPPHWQVRSGRVPPVGTPVQLVIRPAGAARRTAQSPRRPPRRAGSAARQARTATGRPTGPGPSSHGPSRSRPS